MSAVQTPPLPCPGSALPLLLDLLCFYVISSRDSPAPACTCPSLAATAQSGARALASWCPFPGPSIVFLQRKFRQGLAGTCSSPPDAASPASDWVCPGPAAGALFSGERVDSSQSRPVVTVSPGPRCQHSPGAIAGRDLPRGGHAEGQPAASEQTFPKDTEGWGQGAGPAASNSAITLWRPFVHGLLSFPAFIQPLH